MDQSQGFLHMRQVLYHWATSPPQQVVCIAYLTLQQLQTKKHRMSEHPLASIAGRVLSHGGRTPPIQLLLEVIGRQLSMWGLHNPGEQTIRTQGSTGSAFVSVTGSSPSFCSSQFSDKHTAFSSLLALCTIFFTWKSCVKNHENKTLPK